MESGNQPTIRNVPQASGQPQQPVVVIVQAPPTHGSVQQKRSDEEYYCKFFPKKTILGLCLYVGGWHFVNVGPGDIHIFLSKWQDFFVKLILVSILM